MSAVTASAIVTDDSSVTVFLPDEVSATAQVVWGNVSVGIAFSNTPVPSVLLPESVIANSTATGGRAFGVDLTPISASAVSVQSNTVDPPSVRGEQLTFSWG